MFAKIKTRLTVFPRALGSFYALAVCAGLAAAALGLAHAGAPTNLAVGKPASQSSTDRNLPAALTVDQDPTTFSLTIPEVGP